MRKLFHSIVALACITAASHRYFGQDEKHPAEKPGPRKSGFYQYERLGTSPGLGLIGQTPCVAAVASQPAVYAGNILFDCDGEVPHNETSITVNPNNPAHAVGAYHSYQLSFLGATVISHVVSAISATFDGGATWHQTIPPISPYQFTGDPAVAFDANGRVYLASIADHEGPGGPFTGPSVVVTHSDNGGLQWSDLVTVASGQGAVTKKGDSGVLLFQDKDYIGVDTGSFSPYRNRAYITWTGFRESPFTFVAPIMLARSDDGNNWSAGKPISGSNPACSAPVGGNGECSNNQFSSPAVAPNGKVYVAFENFNTPAENQYLVVSSTNGGQTFSNPSRVATIYDINLPIEDGDQVLTGCAFRFGAPGNLAVDPNDPTGNTVYVAWADNRNGTATATNTDVVLARSTNGGLTWVTNVIDNTPNDQFYAWVSVAPTGRVDVGYMDRGYSSGQNVCQYGFALTRLTFAANGAVNTKTKTRVDTALSDAGHSRWYSAATGGNTVFIGDYNGIAVGSDGKTWSLWTDLRNIVANPPNANRNHGMHAVGAKTNP